MSQIETLEAPISVIEKIEITLIDGTVIDINVQDLLAEGYDEEELETMINSRLMANDDLIEDASFLINTTHVANAVQPVTL